MDELPLINGLGITVIGVGGGGTNAVSRMIDAGMTGVKFIAANTDGRALTANRVPTKIQIGKKLTKGLGAGGDPNVGRQAALENTDELIEAMSGADLVFVVVGLGGGTGTGAAPVIASIATELGALTIVVATTPFRFEGKRRFQQAETGVEQVRVAADATITIENEQLLAVMDRNTSMLDAFKVVDDAVHQAVRAISDLLIVPGLINLDFADIKTIMSGTGAATVGSATASGTARSTEAAQSAMSRAELDGTIAPVRGVIVNVSGGSDMSLLEVNQALTIIQEGANPEADIVFGAIVDPSLGGNIRITIITVGRDADAVTDSRAHLAYLRRAHIAYVRNAATGTGKPNITEAAFAINAFSSAHFQASDQSEESGEIVVVWDPSVVDATDYGLLIEALGDIARASGGVGIKRLRGWTQGSPVREQVPV